MTLHSLANIVLRQRRLVASSVVLTVVVVGIAALVWPRTFLAETEFVPGQGGTPAVAGIAAQLGLAAPSTAGGDPPQLYLELITSRGILRDLATTPLTWDDPGRSGGAWSGTLVEFYGLEGDTPEARLRATVSRLQDDIMASYDATPGLIRMDVRAPKPETAVAVSQRILDLLEAYNSEKRRSQAAAQREFVEARLDDARRSLEEAESEMEDFLASNRTYESSPSLVFEAARIQRRVDLQQQLYLALAQSYESARIDEVRSIPVFTVVERPEHTVRPKRPRLALLLPVALMVGLTVGLFLGFARDFVQHQSSASADEVQEFRSLWAESVRDLRMLWPGAWLGRRT